MGLNETFAALADPTRRKIITLLRKGKLSAGEIAKNFDSTNPNISYHLKKLKEAGLVRETREKNFIYYDVNMTEFDEILHWIEASPEVLAELSENPKNG